MGVKNLWSIIEDIEKHVSLEELSGQVLAIDLSIWIVEANRALSKSIKKPYLRHIFFRVWNLLRLNILPVVVVEGKVPVIKQEVIKLRLGHSANDLKPLTRTRFNAIQKECCKMLDYLGVPHVEAAGEAEAMCAYLNYIGLVNACITNDGDAFLYGATDVYRNFSTNKDPSVGVYKYSDIKQKFKLSRENLIGFAILCGCDYLIKGIPGCGPRLVVQLINEIKEKNLIDSFKKWHAANYNVFAMELGKIESNVCMKAKMCPGFPFNDIIDEFLINRNKLPKEEFKWFRPDINFVIFAVEQLEWTQEYSLEKIINCLSFYELTQIMPNQQNRLLIPNRILKSVIRNGVKSFEVEWKRIELDDFSGKEFYITCEGQELIESNFSELVRQFKQQTLLNKLPKKGKSKKTIKAAEDFNQLSSLIESINLNSEGNKKVVKTKNIFSQNIDLKHGSSNERFQMNRCETGNTIGCIKNVETNNNTQIRRSISLNCIVECGSNRTSNRHTSSIKNNSNMALNLDEDTYTAASYDFKIGNFELESSILCFTPEIKSTIGKEDINNKESLLSGDNYVTLNLTDDMNCSRDKLNCKDINSDLLVKENRTPLNYYNLSLAERLKLKNIKIN